MILQRCQNLTARITKKKWFEQSVNQIRRFRKVRDVLVQHGDRLAPPLSVWRTLRDAGIPVGDTSASVRPAVATRSAKCWLLIDECPLSVVT